MEAIKENGAADVKRKPIDPSDANFISRIVLMIRNNNFANSPRRQLGPPARHPDDRLSASGNSAFPTMSGAFVLRDQPAPFRTLAPGLGKNVETSSIHLDTIRDLKQINSMSTTIAYPVLEQQGLLPGSRLKAV